MEKITLPVGTLACEAVDSYTAKNESLKGGRFRFIGAKFVDQDRLRLIVIDDKANTVVDSYRTKMKKMEHMDMLLEQIIQDRKDKLFRPFGVYCTAWIAKNGHLRIPPKKD